MSGKSPFRACGRDLAEFFKSTGWALYGEMKNTRKHWPTYHLFAVGSLAGWPPSKWRRAKLHSDLATDRRRPTAVKRRGRRVDTA